MVYGIILFTVKLHYIHKNDVWTYNVKADGLHTLRGVKGYNRNDSHQISSSNYSKSSGTIFTITNYSNNK